MPPIRCIAIRLSGGSRHEHITHIKWVQDGQIAQSVSTRGEMVTYVEKGGKAYVKDAKGNVAYLAVRQTTSGTKYVQTYADGIWSDNLLALPTL